MKVFITGIGSDLGTAIAQLLEKRSDVEAIAGVDMFPPRRYLARTKFSISHHDDWLRIGELITDFSPDVIINFGVYEPGARLGLTKARSATQGTSLGIISATKKVKKKHPVKIITRSSVTDDCFENS